MKNTAHKTLFATRTKLCTAFVALALGSAALAGQAPVAKKTMDVGAMSVGTSHSFAIAMQLRDQAGAEAYARETATPGHENYRKFLTVAEYRKRFGPTDESLAQAANYMHSMGFQKVSVAANGLSIRAEGSVARINHVFSTEMHEYVDAAGQRFQAPSVRPALPLELQRANALAVMNLSTQHHLDPMVVHVPSDTGDIPLVLPTTATANGSVAGTATGKPGSFTVGDVAQRYNVTPLYNNNITGKNTTIGILTLANFYPADAFTYWNSIGLSVDPNRLTQVHVDGGAGAPSSRAGSGETSLDVEQSGGLAPDANIIVYDAPNTDQGLFDVFNQAVAENKADVLSISWGSPESFYFQGPITGGVDATDELKAIHNVLTEAAVQGISVFAAAGDAGAYDTNREAPYPNYTKFLSVDYPASDPMITAAGGTTLPVTLTFKNGTVVTVPQERPWAWDYLSDYITKVYGSADAVYSTIFSTGGGGGVSSYWPMPAWQSMVTGTQKTPAGQVLASTGANPTTFVTLPAGFRGRNVPDVSLNADPETGYSVVSMADAPTKQGWVTGEGGTSFVAPQLAGITALLTQSAGKRVGLLTQQLYVLQAMYGYNSNSPFNAITAGDNWYYKATKSYNPATGLGTLNVANLAKYIK